MNSNTIYTFKSKPVFTLLLFVSVIIFILIAKFYLLNATTNTRDFKHSRVGSNQNFQKYKLKNVNVIREFASDLQELKDEENSPTILEEISYDKAQVTTSLPEYIKLPDIWRLNEDKYKKATPTTKHLIESESKENLQLQLTNKERFTSAETLKTYLDAVQHCITGDIVYTYKNFYDNADFVTFDKIDIATILRKEDQFHKNASGIMEKENSVMRNQSFQQVFDTRAWGHGWDSNNKGLNASGRGATVHWAQEMIATLHITINYLKVTLNQTTISMLDIPCGDMVWMSRFLSTRTDIKYTGMDIVPDLIQHHQKFYQHNQNWTFINQDILTSETLGSYDLIVNRMMLQHLYQSDILKLLRKFSSSGSKYILTTTFPSEYKNSELFLSEDNPGRFRPVNLQLPPFSLAPPICLARDGPPEIQEAWKHTIALWKLPLKRISMCKDEIVKKNLKHSLLQMYICKFMDK